MGTAGSGEKAKGEGGELERWQSIMYFDKHAPSISPAFNPLKRPTELGAAVQTWLRRGMFRIAVPNERCSGSEVGEPDF